MFKLTYIKGGQEHVRECGLESTARFWFRDLLRDWTIEKITVTDPDGKVVAHMEWPQ